MAPYDSDSSGGEDEDFTETNVLLGYASKEVGDDTISYLGGRPVCSFPLQLLSKAFRLDLQPKHPSKGRINADVDFFTDLD